ncbi:MAG: phosphatase PAP2 family protein [Lachnospiraceae bacterium]|nr:phosphatase PAP2 family protein [Lachnospiraceae bacterium]
MEKLKEFYYKYNLLIIILYFPLYMLWFVWLEKRKVPYFEIHCKLDDIIPFNEYFIVPYMMWFAYVVIIVVLLGVKLSYMPWYKESFPLYNFFKNRSDRDFALCSLQLILGMTISLIIFTVFPNCQNLRPEMLELDNFFARVVAGLYKTDTSTNVFPSLHVYNALVVNHWFCVSKSLNSSSNKVKVICQGISVIICVMICLSTMFLKQHSALDVLGALVLFALLRLVTEFNTIKKSDTVKKSNTSKQ